MEQHHPITRTANFPRDCTVCHTTQQWKGAKFDHTKTRFPLTGAHITTSCAQCHINGKYTGTSTQCIACHQTDYNGAKNPNHLTAGFPEGLHRLPHHHRLERRSL